MLVVVSILPPSCMLHKLKYYLNKHLHRKGLRRISFGQLIPHKNVLKSLEKQQEQKQNKYQIYNFNSNL